MDFTSLISLISIIFAVPAFVISFFFNLHSLNINRTNKFSDNIAEFNVLIIQYPDLNYLFDNEEVEKRRSNIDFYNQMSAFISLHFNMLENLYIQLLSKKLFVSKEQKKVWETYIVDMFNTKLTVEEWDINKKFYDKNFMNYIDKLIGIKNENNFITRIKNRIFNKNT